MADSVIRTLICNPAGIARVDLKRLITLTAIGSAILCFALFYVGYAMGPHWRTLDVWFRKADVLMSYDSFPPHG